MSKRFFNLASLVLQYLIPFSVITYSYTKVWIILSNRTRPGKTKAKEELELKRKKRTNRMLVAMVIIFAGCWMPLNCVHLIMEFNIDFTKNPYFSNVFFIAHVIAMSSTIYNPFLYAWLNDNFRKEFRLILPWIFTAIKWCSKADHIEEDEINFDRSKFINNTLNTNMAVRCSLEDTDKNKFLTGGNTNILLLNNKKNISTVLNLKENKSLLKASNNADDLNKDVDYLGKKIKDENNVTFDLPNERKIRNF